MDPDATVADLVSLRADLAKAKGDAWLTGQIRADIRDRRAALREWRRKGGFAPRIGWRAALAL